MQTFNWTFYLLRHIILKSLPKKNKLAEEHILFLIDKAFKPKVERNVGLNNSNLPVRHLNSNLLTRQLINRVLDLITLHFIIRCAPIDLIMYVNKDRDSVSAFAFFFVFGLSLSELSGWWGPRQDHRTKLDLTVKYIYWH